MQVKARVGIRAPYLGGAVRAVIAAALLATVPGHLSPSGIVEGQ